MINVIRFKELGHHNYGWLDAHYHFSFGDYHDPARMGFGPIRVINDDTIKAGAGFPPHPHDNMEIITYVRRGAITHQDSLGNEGRTAAGDVQVMSAGSGIRHAEFNGEDGETTLYQIWIKPRERGIAPRWDSAKFPQEPVNDRLKLLVSGDKKNEGALYINADAAIYAGHIKAGSAIQQPTGAQAYLLVSEGSVTLNGQTLHKGDGAAITGESLLTLAANDDSDVLLIDLPAAA